MAAVKVELDMDDFFESFNGEGIVAEMRAAMAEEVMKVVKRDPRYKAYIQNQALEAIKKLESN